MNNTLSATKSEYLNRIIDLTASKTRMNLNFYRQLKRFYLHLNLLFLKHEEEYKPIALFRKSGRT